jgi:hypothetical protein
MGVRKSSGPSVLILRCEECEKRVGRNGYLKIDRIAVAKRFQTVGDWEVMDADSERVFWQILHADCDTDPKPTDYRLSAHVFSTTSDLLEATAFLLRSQPELMVASNRHGLIGRILADTREYADWLASPKRAETNRARRQRVEQKTRTGRPERPEAWNASRVPLRMQV